MNKITRKKSPGKEHSMFILMKSTILTITRKPRIYKRQDKH